MNITHPIFSNPPTSSYMHQFLSPCKQQEAGRGVMMMKKINGQEERERSKKLFKYLKPGAPAHVRDTKIAAAAMSQRNGLLKSLLTEPLCLLSEGETLLPNQMENVPCFALRFNKGHPQCPADEETCGDYACVC
ncbi:hypothetical protein Dsin_027943 [Dipteronia sinensis]|uniref:Uncharacterized protein n=1 Tax=Dipteronia sinensis TaxID=43782 RepID=A0AAE0DV32_9ROSI|nr:hypothetical protein Dsin_027943 [Dipteronia sinensis]